MPTSRPRHFVTGTDALAAALDAAARRCSFDRRLSTADAGLRTVGA